MRELSYLNKGITITFTDKRELDKDGICFWNFHSDEGLKNTYSLFRWKSWAIIAHVISSMDNEKDSCWSSLDL
jgi:DNA gyrase subunit B